MVGNILPLLSLEKRNQPVKANGAPWEYPKEEVACRACSRRTTATGLWGTPEAALFSGQTREPEGLQSTVGGYSQAQGWEVTS